MKIITRYVLSNFFRIFFFTQGGLLAVCILFMTSHTTVKMGIPFSLACQAIPAILPNVLGYTMPVSCLAGGTLFFAKMVNSNEIIALKALGVPPWKVFLPVWLATLLLSGAAVLCNDLEFSWGRKEMARVIYSGFEETILNKLATDGKFADPQNKIVLNAGEVTKSGELKQVKFILNNPPVQGEAATGRLEVDFDADPQVLRIELSGLLLDTSNTMIMQHDTIVQEIPLDQICEMARGDIPYRAMKEVKGALAELRAKEEKLKRETAARTAFALIKGDYDSWQDPSWGWKWDEQNNLRYRYYRMNMTTSRSISFGFACFFFVWVGIPMAVWLNCSDFVSSLFMSLAPTLIVYCPLLMFSYSCIKDGQAPPVFCWLGNLVLGVIGIWILRQVHKH